jgi:signal transduction histidine kinase/CheY-like chemotaxis protein
MKPLKNKFFLLILILLNISVHAQVNLDSLWGVWIDNGQEDTARLKAIYQFAYKGYLHTKPDSAIYFAQFMLDFAEKVENQYYQAKSYYLIGWIQSENDNNFEAKKNYVQALKFYQNIGDRYGISNILWNLGLAHYNMGQYVAAMENYSKSLTITRELNDTSGISGLLTNIGLIYKTQEDYPKALEYYEQGARILEEAGSLNHVALNNIIEIYIEQGDHKKAFNYLNERLKQIESGKTGDYYDSTFATVSILKFLGDIYALKGDNTQAMDYYMRCLELKKKDSLNSSVAFYQRKIGLLYVSMKKGELAVEWCSRALKGHKDTESIRDQREDCECLFKSYKLLGDNTRALAYYELFHLLNDSLKLEETAKSLQQMEFARQLLADSLTQVENELQIEMAHQVELGKKERAKNIFIISGLIILIIAGGLWSRMLFIRKSNARLKKEKDRAERSEQFKQQFLANMSHEIRTPMNAIMGMTDILMRRKPKTDQMKYLEGIKDSSDSLLVIINDILDLSKIEVGKIDLEHIPFSISEVVQNVQTIMQFKAEEKGLELKSDIPKNIPQVIGDPTRLRQVIINLVGNAIKFTEKGIVTVSLKIETQKNDTEVNVHFTISDTGIGIDKDQLEQVFNSFEQAYSDTTRKYGGTGLGLSISKKLIDLHKGKIWAESKKGQGSQFHFTIPYQVCHEQKNEEVVSTASNIESISNQLKGIRVLLVEDNAFNAVVAQEELEDAITDTNVVVAENGAIAVEQISHNNFDIVLMDVQMPVMNGYEATKAIRDLDSEKSKIPIIAMTANVLKEEVELCHKTGMNDFIGKPFETEELIQKIHKLIHKQT